MKSFASVDHLKLKEFYANLIMLMMHYTKLGITRLCDWKRMYINVSFIILSAERAYEVYTVRIWSFICHINMQHMYYATHIVHFILQCKALYAWAEGFMEC